MKFTVDGNVIEGTPEEFMRVIALMGGEQAEIEKEPTAYRVGDIVRITKDFLEHSAGDIKVIREFDESDNVFSVGFNEIDGSKGGWGNYDIVEKLSESDVKIAKLGRKPGEFKNGDIVRGNNGKVGVVRYDNTPNQKGITIDFFDGSGGITYKDIELIAPVESRVDVE